MFKITIQEVREIKRTPSRGEYGFIGKTFISAVEYENLAYADKTQFKRIVDGDNVQYVKENWDYRPAVETIEEKEIKVYEQVVDALDIGAVIQAVNDRSIAR